MRQVNREIVTPREMNEQEFEKEMFDRQAQHALLIKEMELQSQKLSVHWHNLLKIPMVIITLPVRILFVIPISISAITGKPLPDKFWDLLT